MAASACVDRADIEAQLGASSSADEPEIVFREIRHADIAELKQLQRVLFPVQYSDTFYQRLFTDGYYTIVGVTVPDGELVAVASVRTVQHSDEAYIMTLGVKETFRRRQLGTRVMQECLDLIQGLAPCDVAVLHVKSDNHGALKFYERYGFSVDPDGFCKDHYLIDGVLHDAYRLSYVLPQPQSSSFFSFLPRCTVI